VLKVASAEQGRQSVPSKVGAVSTSQAMQVLTKLNCVVGSTLNPLLHTHSTPDEACREFSEHITQENIVVS